MVSSDFRNNVLRIYMAAGWFTVLKAVPWSEVISAAPQLASGARRLWDAVGRKAPLEETPEQAGQYEYPDTVGALVQRLERNEATIADLHGQMLSASEIIARLADQNSQLVVKMEAARVRMVWLGVATGAALLLAVVAIIVAAT